MKNYFYLLIVIFSFSCSKDPAEVSDPTSFELIFPANNETCLEGSKIINCISAASPSKGNFLLGIIYFRSL